MTGAIKSVIIVTEDLVVINQISSILRQYNYSVILESPTTKSIIKILKKGLSFLILDLDIPNNSNMGLIDNIKRIRPGLPIVILSKDSSIETVRKLTQVGVFYYLLKPINIAEIEKVLEAIERFHQKQIMLRNFI